MVFQVVFFNVKPNGKTLVFDFDNKLGVSSAVLKYIDVCDKIIISQKVD
jgi:hypothetical protein